MTASIHAFPGARASDLAHDPAPRHFTRAKSLIDAADCVAAAAQHLISDGLALMSGDTPTEADATSNGATIENLVDAAATLIRVNGIKDSDAALLAEIERWMDRRAGL